MINPEKKLNKYITDMQRGVVYSASSVSFIPAWDSSDNTLFAEKNDITDDIMQSAAINISRSAVSFANTLYTSENDVLDSLLFNSVDEKRLLDVEKKLFMYENKYDISSEEFYKNWLRRKEPDNSDYNKWARTYSFLRYAKEA